jgi:hypothetical protein
LIVVSAKGLSMDGGVDSKVAEDTTVILRTSAQNILCFMWDEFRIFWISPAIGRPLNRP